MIYIGLCNLLQGRTSANSHTSVQFVNNTQLGVVSAQSVETRRPHGARPRSGAWVLGYGDSPLPPPHQLEGLRNAVSSPSDDWGHAPI